MPVCLDLLEGVVDQPLVVFLRQVPLEQLRSDRHGQIDGLLADLLERALGLELDLSLGIADHPSASALAFWLQFFAQPRGVAARLVDDAAASAACVLQFRCVLLQPGLGFVADPALRRRATCE